jgi:hypothetical protein
LSARSVFCAKQLSFVNSALHAAFAQARKLLVRGDFGGTVEDVRKSQ